jgi:hypothetical protein
MGKWLIRYVNDDEPKEVSDVEIIRTRLTDLKYQWMGFKYRFQYDRSDDHRRALSGEWVRGYELYKKFIRDVYIRYEDSEPNI